MDPCRFVRIIIGNLALNLPQPSHLSSQQFYSKSKLKSFPSQLSDLPLSDAADSKIHACFTLTKPDLQKLADKPSRFSRLKIEIHRRGSTSSSNCGFIKRGKLLGFVVLQLDLKSILENNRTCVIQNGWAPISAGSDLKLHLNVRAEPDPRFVFQFGGEPECSPQVFQIKGNVKQPVFTCNFSFRHCSKRNSNRRSISASEGGAVAAACCFGSVSDEDSAEVEEERKGWSVTIHDLSGSPVAAASMVTPFVPPSRGADRVGKSNPGAWLILRPGYSAWRPWGRLEAWRERDDVRYRFELIPDGAAADSITLANSSIKMKNGGKFSIDVTTGPTPLTSPSSSFDLSSGGGSWSDIGSASGSGSWAHLLYRGFVMSSTVGGGGRGSKPEVEVGVQHVTCTEDAAAFVALAAAMDLSIDACCLFSKKLRKELRQPDLS